MRFEDARVRYRWKASLALSCWAVSAYAQAQPAAGRPPACAPFTNPVVPGACLGEFRHGTLVRRTGAETSAVLELAHGGADATDTYVGVDLVADCGSPVYTLADGVVVDVISDTNDPDFTGLGYMVRIKHPATSTGLPLPATQVRQTETFYSHLQAPPTAQFGRVLTEHTQIGTVGRTGTTGSCFTHFEVRHFAGRYMVDKAWNLPPAIYGRGDQTGTKLLQENWTDPVRWLTALPPELKGPSEVILEKATSATSRLSPEPTTTFMDVGACPGEGCRYGDTWTMEASTTVHPARGASVTSFLLKPGQRVTTLTGAVSTEPGKIRIIHPVRVAGQQLVRSGYLYVLTYREEGFWKVWLNGAVTDAVAIHGVSSPIPCTISETPCREKAENRLIAGPIWGELENVPRPHWWVQIRDGAGRVGWIEVTGPTWTSVNGEF